MSNELVSTEHLLFCEFVKKGNISHGKDVGVCNFFISFFYCSSSTWMSSGKKTRGNGARNSFYTRDTPLCLEIE